MGVGPGLPVSAQVAARVAAGAGAGVEPAGEPVAIATFELVEQALAHVHDLAAAGARRNVEQREVAAPPGQTQLRRGQRLEPHRKWRFSGRHDLQTPGCPGLPSGRTPVPSPQPGPSKGRGQEQERKDDDSADRAQQRPQADEYQAPAQVAAPQRRPARPPGPVAPGMSPSEVSCLRSEVARAPTNTPTTTHPTAAAGLARTAIAASTRPAAAATP